MYINSCIEKRSHLHTEPGASINREYLWILADKKLEGIQRLITKLP